MVEITYQMVLGTLQTIALVVGIFFYITRAHYVTTSKKL
jgi:hypothetical protein